MLSASLNKVLPSLSRLQTVWSESLRSPRICVAVGITVVVRFRRWRTRMYQSWAAVVNLWLSDLCLSLTLLSGAEMVCVVTSCYLTIAFRVAPACNLPLTSLRWADLNLDIIALPMRLPSVVMRSEWITADVAFYVPPMEGSAYKVTDHDARASQRVAFLRVSTNVEYGYVYVNRTFSSVFIFLYDVFDSVKKKNPIALFFTNLMCCFFIFLSLCV